MLDLTTRYLGLTLKNPLIAASSGYTSNLEHITQLEQNGIAAVVLKSIFEEEIINQFHESMGGLDKFHSNMEYLDYYDYELKNENINNYVQLIRNAKAKVSIPIIASINCVSNSEWTFFAKKLQEAGADALELNIFIMPSDQTKTGEQIENTYIDIINRVRKEVKIPVSVKMSSYFSNLSAMIQRISETKIDGIVLFNRFISADFDIDKIAVSPSYVFSNDKEYSLPLRWTAIMSSKIKCSIAASNGIHDSEALIKLLLAGADAVQIASTIYLNGMGQIDFMLKNLEDWMQSKNYTSISHFKGALSYNNLKNPAELERVQFMRYFSDHAIDNK